MLVGEKKYMRNISLKKKKHLALGQKVCVLAWASLPRVWSEVSLLQL